MRFSFAWLVLAAIAAGCTSGPVQPDAAMDGGSDAFVPARDAAACPLDCPTGRACCFGTDGTPHCVDLANDIQNCGICNRDCVATRRGDSCAHNQCGCGDFSIGCTGAENSICCPAVAGSRPYCANPGLDLGDCGGCGRTCDRNQASQCSGGLCLCGDTGGRCAGTVSDACCADLAGAYSCVDTRTDQAHCGACGHRCTAFQRCDTGVCVPTIADAGVDAP